MKSGAAQHVRDRRTCHRARRYSRHMRKCEHCRSGYFIFCRTGEDRSCVDGAFTRYHRRPSRSAPIAFPTAFLSKRQRSASLRRCRAGRVRDYRVQPEDTVLVSSPAPSDSCVSSCSPPTVFAPSSRCRCEDERLGGGGANRRRDVVNPQARTSRKRSRTLLAGTGVDVALACAGHPSSVRACLDSLLRPMGLHSDCHLRPRYPVSDRPDALQQLTVRGSITYTARTWQRMMDIYARGTVRLLIACLRNYRFPMGARRRFVCRPEGAEGSDVSDD